MNVDTTVGIFYSKGRLVDVAASILRTRPENLTQKFTGADAKTNVQLIQRAIKGLEVETTHSKKTRKYKVFKVGENSARNEIFEMRDGTKKSIYDYFFEQYQMRLIFPDLPCIILTNKTILPIEVVMICAGQRYIKKLDAATTDKVLRESTLKPIDKFNKIIGGIETIMEASPEAKKYCMNWGFDVMSDKLLELDAQVIPPPVVMCTILHPCCINE